MDKKGIGGNNAVMTIVFVVVGIVFVWLALSITGVIGEGPAATITPTQTQTETGIQDVTALVSCPSDQTTDGQVRYEDTLAATNSYGNPTTYFMPKTAGQERVTAGTLQTDGTYSTAVDLACLESGTEWEAVAVASQDAWHSVAEGIDFTASGSAVKRDIKGKAYEILQLKIEDIFTGGASFLNITNCGGDTDGSLSYLALNGSACTATNTVGVTGTSLTLAADGYLDLKISVKTNQTKTQFGEDGLRTWLLVDADASDWDEPIIGRDNGPTLVDNLNGLSDSDDRYYSGREYAYELGSIGDRESVIDFYMQSASGVNPDFDPVLDFCTESRYDSSKDIDAIKIGCWSDAATQAQISTGVIQRVTIDIS